VPRLRLGRGSRKMAIYANIMAHFARCFAHFATFKNVQGIVTMPRDIDF